MAEQIGLRKHSALYSHLKINQSAEMLFFSASYLKSYKIKIPKRLEMTSRKLKKKHRWNKNLKGILIHIKLVSARKPDIRSFLISLNYFTLTVSYNAADYSIRILIFTFC